MTERRVAAVVLAAGESRRLGEPKQLVKVGGEALLERAVRVAREVGCEPIVVVLGAEAQRIRAACGLGDVVIVENEQWNAGMASSLQTGIHAVGEVDGALLMTCDQPAVSASHLRALMATGEVTASEYAGRRGVPVYLPASSFAALTLLRGDAGARELLHTAQTVELPGGELDIDTPDELARARAWFG